MLSYSTLRESLDIENLAADSEGLAYLTHYLQNSKNGVSQFFKPNAEAYYRHLQPPVSGVKDDGIQALLPLKWDIPFPPPEQPDFTFIDLFAGIGGFRLALQSLNGKCVYSSEYNTYAQKAYELNFGEVPFGDITKFDLEKIPPHDVLCAGFPCQPFSISGKMKGFEDTRGTLIYYVFKIIELRQPKVVFLENVKHLIYHNKKRTLATIIQHLKELGYTVSAKLLNASDYGVPQNRERIILVCHKDKFFDFNAIQKQPKPVLRDFLENEGEFEFIDEPYTILEERRQQDSGLIFAGYRNKKIRKAGVRPGTEHLSRVHKQPNRIYSSDGTHPALPSQESSGRFWIWHDGRVRKLTIRECYRIMGFPEEFKFIYSKSELYKQVGNSVCVPMIRAIGEQIKKQLL
jgi:DNA (cytosine-5)-methyltransferase 1